MSLLISSVYTYDADASAYILAVEAADEIASPGIGVLEPATRSAINKFVVGCKADGTWTAIKASCILAGARTLAGALVPLAGTAPTNVGPFVSGDYNRKTGLVGDGSTKYLDSNRASNADPQNNHHYSVQITDTGTPTSYRTHIANRFINNSQEFAQCLSTSDGSIYITNRTPYGLGYSAPEGNIAGFRGSSRFQASNYVSYSRGDARTLNDTSFAPSTANYFLFARNATPVAVYSDARLAFYSIGESLDLALLDARVTYLINAFAVTIP